MANPNEKISKFLSYVLRHSPDEIGLQLDAEGWASVEELIDKARSAGTILTPELIEQVVRTNDKQRFALSDDRSRIRANQGHSVKIELNLPSRQPPEYLYHGTATRFVDAIRREGLKAMSRQHVHLSIDEPTAHKVGQRHGKPIILKISAGEMWRAGQQFFLSDNGVWLTGKVELKYINFPT
jgi:putative RNA 2'-phosphotransferase